MRGIVVEAAFGESPGSGESAESGEALITVRGPKGEAPPPSDQP